jgi:hypothetical protein
MANDRQDSYSVHFAHYATKLEQHLRKNGISCHDADIIIEESSVLYFEKLHSPESKIFKLIRKHDPLQLFVESACKAIKQHIPEARHTFGSQGEIAKCVR